MCSSKLTIACRSNAHQRLAASQYTLDPGRERAVPRRQVAYPNHQVRRLTRTPALTQGLTKIYAKFLEADKTQGHSGAAPTLRLLVYPGVGQVAVRHHLADVPGRVELPAPVVRAQVVLVQGAGRRRGARFCELRQPPGRRRTRFVRSVAKSLHFGVNNTWSRGMGFGG